MIYLFKYTEKCCFCRQEKKFDKQSGREYKIGNLFLQQVPTQKGISLIQGIMPRSRELQPFTGCGYLTVLTPY
jgi:hypothetical protein